MIPTIDRKNRFETGGNFSFRNLGENFNTVNWTGAGVLGTQVPKMFRYYWHRTGATTADAALSAPLVKLNMRYESVSRNKLSIGKFLIGKWSQKQKSSYREIPYRGVATSQNWTGA